MPEGAIANRRAALLAHAMPAADRAWLLAELDPDRRGVLAGLLDELRSMGIPRDPALVRQLLDEEAAGSPDRSLTALGPDALPRLFDVLRGEPETIVAIFLHAQSWPWRGAALQELGVAVRDAYARHPVPAPQRLEQAVVVAVWNAVQSRHPVPPVPKRAGRWTAFLRRVLRS